MKKILSFMAAAFMVLTLTTGCITTSKKPLMQPKAHKTCKFEIINNTEFFAIAIMCVIPLPAEEGDRCLFKPIALYPKTMVEKQPDKLINKVVLELEPGDYGFLIVGLDIRTGEQSAEKLQGRIIEDGQLIFKEDKMNVKGRLDV